MPGSSQLSTALIGITAAVSSFLVSRASGATPDRLKIDLDHISGVAELGVGLLTLPTARVCTNRGADLCTTGDSSLMLEGWQLIRTSRNFTAGAGITLGLFPTANVPLNDAAGVDREHSRSYLTAEALIRWYPYTSSTWEGWVGGTTGLVVVSDTFTSAEGQPSRALVGPRGVTTRTEGLSVGVGLGVERPVVGNWIVGASFRYGYWMLPKNPATTPLGDEASLTGRNSMFLLGFTIGYRIRIY